MTGTVQLVRLVLRRDRVLLAIWVLGMGLLPVAIAAGAVAGYPNQDALDAYAAAAAANPAETALRGPILAATTGGITAWTLASSGILVTGTISLLMAVRHTRADEERGRRDALLGPDRGAFSAAALIVVAAANLAAAVLGTVGMTALGLPVAGSVALGLVLALGGTLFGAVGVAAAQLAAGAGGARGLAAVLLAASLALATPGSWASPLEWGRQVRAFAGERWWVLLLFVAAIAVVAGLALVAAGRRDVGFGLIPVRAGRAHGSLRGPIGLAWRLHRGTVLGWALGAALFGLLIGAVAPSAAEQAPGIDFVRLVLYVMAQAVAASAIIGAQRLSGQESAGLADPLLAGPVGRVRWAGGHLVATTSGAALVLTALGLGAGLGSGEPFALLGTTLAYLPACLVLAGLAVAVHGWAPAAAAPVAWTVFGLTLAVDLLSEFRLIGIGVSGLSPFVATIVSLTTGSGLGLSLAVLVVVAVAFTAVGLVGLTRRDLR